MLVARNCFVLLLSGVVAGCNGPGLVDDVDVNFDWRPIKHSNSLHMPYVAGSSFSLAARRSHRNRFEGWTFESRDAGVLRIDDTVDATASVSAVAAGDAEVRLVKDSGRVASGAVLQVREATRFEVLAHGPLILDREDLQEEWDPIRVVVGGSATFQVVWYEGTQRLFGNGALDISSGAELETIARRSYLFEDREWLTVTPTTEGVHDVEVLADGRALGTVTVVGVPESAVDAVELHGMSELEASSGEELTVLAQAYDVDGNALFGLDYNWELDGIPQDGAGDLYRYEYAPNQQAELCARYGDQEVVVEIHGSEGLVDSTNNLGCSISSPSRKSNRGAGFALLVLVGALWIARRLRVRIPRRNEDEIHLDMG